MKLNKFRAKKYKLLVVRFKDNNLVDSKPCIDCLKFLYKFGINRVYYSNADGQIISQTIADLELISRPCSGRRSINTY